MRFLFGLACSALPLRVFAALGRRRRARYRALAAQMRGRHVDAGPFVPGAIRGDVVRFLPPVSVKPRMTVSAASPACSVTTGTPPATIVVAAAPPLPISSMALPPRSIDSMYRPGRDDDAIPVDGAVDRRLDALARSDEFLFFSNEGAEPPHVHVEQAGAVAKFWLEPRILGFVQPAPGTRAAATGAGGGRTPRRVLGGMA